MLQALHDVVTAACAAEAVIVIGAASLDSRKKAVRRGIVAVARCNSRA
jgi:hypothetical protein